MLRRGDILGGMSRRVLCGDLNAVRALVADGLARLDGTFGGLDQYWASSARSRLKSLDDMLVAAAGGLSGWSRTLIGAAMAFPVAWAVAATARLAGFAPVWAIVSTVLALGAFTPVLLAVTNRLAGLVNRRRMARAPRPVQPFRLAVVTPGWLDDVPEPLLAARVMLVSAALRQVESRHWRVPYLVRLAGSDRSISRIAEADLLLCQAIDYLEIYVAEQELGRVG
jgi:hypothetical protein